MTYKVSVSSNSFSVKLKSTPNLQVNTGVEVARLQDLSDVNVTGVENGFILTYDAATQTYVTLNPDNVLSNAVPGGLPADFINTLDVDLDNKVDVDGGSF